MSIMKDYQLVICLDNVVLFWIYNGNVIKVNTNNISYCILKQDNFQMYDIIRNIKVYKIYNKSFYCSKNMYIYNPRSLKVKFEVLFNVQINFSKFLDNIIRNKMFFISDYISGNNLQLNIFHNLHEVQIAYMNLI